MAMTYDLYVEPSVHEARKTLPGNIRQRIGTQIEALALMPRPPDSRSLATEGLDLNATVQVRRIRLDRWVWVLGVYRRPPYNYEDLADLAKRLPRS